MFNLDGQALYAAGRAWLQGSNPYDFGTLSRSVAGVAGMDLGVGLDTIRFFYPPQSAGFCIPLGLLPYSLACVAWLVLNLLSITAIVAMTRSAVRERAEPNMDVWGPWVLAAIIVGSPFTTRVVWMGQTSLVAFAATLGTWLFASRKRWILAGLCLGLASFKPQICVLVVLWIALERDWKTLMVGAAAAAVLASWPMMLQGGPIGALQAWRAGVNADYAMQFNLPSWPHKVGMQSLLGDVGVSVPSSVFLGISLVSVFILWWVRNRIAQFDVLALLMVITLTFSTYLHDYDYVVLAPVFASLWWYSRQSTAVAVFAVSLLVTLVIPQHLVRALGHLVLDQWRTVIVVIMGLIVVACSAASLSWHSAKRVSAGTA
jgi:hypothetical protein